MAALLLQKYRLPLPGTAVFAMPGTARVAAEKAAEFLPLDSIGRQRTRKIVDALERYFHLAEEPLQTEQGKELIPRLTFLSLAENLRATADYLQAEGWAEEDLSKLETWASDVSRSQQRRERVTRSNSHKP